MTSDSTEKPGREGRPRRERELELPDASLRSLSRGMAALGEPHRFFLACRLRHRPYSVGELVEDTGWPQPLVSHHLGILSHAGLVVADRDGRRRLYRLADPVDPSLRALLGLLRHPPVPGRTPPEEAIPDRLDELIAPSRAQPDRGIDDYLL